MEEQKNVDSDKPKRLFYMDIARFIAIFFMVFSHVGLMYGTEEYLNSLFGLIIDVMAGAPAAPVFMFSMGFFVVFTKKTDLKKGIKRGLRIFIAGIVLNLVRYILPVFLGYLFDIVKEPLYGYAIGESFLFLLFEVDILLFAGLAYCLIIILIQYRPKISLPLAFIVVAILSPSLWGIYVDNVAFDIMLDLLWGNRAHVAFPIFPWLCYPILGAWIAKMMFFSDKSKSSIKRVVFIGFALFFVGGIIILLDFENQLSNYYLSRPGAVFAYSGFVILWILGIKNISYLFKGKIRQLIIFTSTNLTSIYCIHWTILGWLIWFLPMNGLGLWNIIVIFIILFPLSLLLSRYIKIKL